MCAPCVNEAVLLCLNDNFLICEFVILLWKAIHFCGLRRSLVSPFTFVTRSKVTTSLRAVAWSFWGVPIRFFALHSHDVQAADFDQLCAFAPLPCQFRAEATQGPLHRRCFVWLLHLSSCFPDYFFFPPRSKMTFLFNPSMPSWDLQPRNSVLLGGVVALRVDWGLRPHWLFVPCALLDQVSRDPCTVVFEFLGFRPVCLTSSALEPHQFPWGFFYLFWCGSPLVSLLTPSIVLLSLFFLFLANCVVLLVNLGWRSRIRSTWLWLRVPIVP